MRGFLEFLNGVPLAGLMLVVTAGYLFGRARWRALSLGPAGGTLLVAIVLGAFGLDLQKFYGSDDPPLTLGTLGFALFIYSIGFEAGPRFFSSLRGTQGWRFVLVGVLVNVFAVMVAVAAGSALNLGESITAGLLSGALTSAPTYAAAVEVCEDTTALAVTFAVTYPLGLAGIVMLVEFLPSLLKENLAEGTTEDEDEDAPKHHGSREFRRAFDVAEPGAIGKSLKELNLTHATGCYVTQLRRGHRTIFPDADTVLQEGDHVVAKGRVDELREFARVVGPEVYDEELRKRIASPRAIRVSASDIHGKQLQELDVFKEHNCLVAEILRGGVSIEPMANVQILRDDTLLVSGNRDDVRELAKKIGRFERSTSETDIAIYAGGILVGLLLGRLQIPGSDFRLGTAAGLLLTGVLLGRFQRIGPFSAHVPRAARQLVRDLGILLFVAETGVRAGANLTSSVRDVLWPTLAAGALTTIVPVVLAVFAGRRLLKLRPADAWGSVCGGMTSSSALVALRSAADSNEPTLSYAAAYAVASVLVTLAGQVVVFVM